MAREAIAQLDPERAAEQAGVTFAQDGAAGGTWAVPFLGRTYHVSYPSGAIVDCESGQTPHHAASLILLHYMVTATGAPREGRWIAFRELPDGMTYHTAFVGRVEPTLVRAFGQHPELLHEASATIGGWRLDLGDSASWINALPAIALACVVYAGDDEFPPSARVLFDASAGHYLPIEDLAVLGGLYASALARAARQHCG